MDKVPWVGNGWVQLTHAQLWVGYGYSCQAQCRTLLLNTNKTTLTNWFLALPYNFYMNEIELKVIY
jgi:hypothetical protein